MTEAALPTAIRTFIDTTNAGDSEGFVTAFTTDAYLNDWGREFRGHDGIRSWNGTDNIGVRSHFDLVTFEPGDKPDSYVVTLTVTGDGYNGTGPMRFELRDGLISRLTIS
ncbi:nuclear transport factor 2 family protein [Streptomyces sp. NPDC050560]|uniref:nuclear transport factor 2 family protein n=1 Tax=Streptomyces sp. NPDC050560 TaxID=3365630 RepID=UPI00379151CE